MSQHQSYRLCLAWMAILWTGAGLALVRGYLWLVGRQNELAARLLVRLQCAVGSKQALTVCQTANVSEEDSRQYAFKGMPPAVIFGLGFAYFRRSKNEFEEAL